jgi:hypothetical protein
MINVLRSDVGHEDFTANCLIDLLDDIDQAAAEMDAEDRLEEGDLRESEQVLREVLAVMADVRITYGYAEFREDTWAEAKRRFSPRWPIC